MKSMPVPKVQRMMRAKINNYIEEQGGEDKLEFCKQDLIDAQQFVIQRAITQISKVQMDKQMGNMEGMSEAEKRKLMMS